MAPSPLGQGLAYRVLQVSRGGWWVGPWGREGYLILGITEAPGRRRDALQAQGEALSGQVPGTTEACKGRSLQLALDEEAKPRGLKNAREVFRTVCPLQRSALPCPPLGPVHQRPLKSGRLQSLQGYHTRWLPR